MNIEKYTICSAAILLEYYDNKIQSFLENCHDDILWLGPAHDQMIRGKDNLIDAFQKEKHELRFTVSNLVSIRSTQAFLLLWTCFLLFSWILSGRMAVQIASIKEFLCYGLCKIISHASGFATFPMRLPMIRGILSILFIMLKPINPWFYPGR